MKPEDRKRLKQHIEMIVEHNPTIEELRDTNRKLRLELHTLRFKEAQEQRFIWWVYNVYSRNVNDLIYAIMGATTYDTEGEAKDGKYALPKKCFDLMKRIDEYTEHIYDGTLLDVEVSMDVKNDKQATNEANGLLRSAYQIALRDGKDTNWEAFRNSVYKELVAEHDAKTLTDNNKCSWIQEADAEICLWRTSCGNSFYFTEGTPIDNRMKYCCYCGKLLQEEE